MSSGRIQAAVLAVTMFLTLFMGLGGVPLFDKDEGAFCEATREMIVSGDYLMPHMNGQPRYDKPILIYWLQAASAHLFGLNEFALRLPSALASVVWALLTYAFARRYFGRDTAFYAAFILLTTVQTTIIAKAAIADAVLNACIAATMFASYIYYDSGRKRWLYAAFAAAAVGMLDKGPIAVMIPLAASFFLALWQRQVKSWAKAAFHPGGLLLFLVIVAPWYVFAIIDQGRPILDAWVLKHTLGRVSAPMEGHSGGILYYVPVVLVGLVPFTSLLFKGIPRLRTLPADPLARYFLIWFLFVFVFFSLAGTKLPHYVIYGYTPLFILMARFVPEVKRDGLLFLPALLLLAAFLALPALQGTLAEAVEDEYAAAVIRDADDVFDAGYWAPLAAAFAALLSMAFLPATRFVKAVVLGLITASAVNFVIVPAAAELTQEPLRRAAFAAREQDYDVVMWRMNHPSFIFYRRAFVETDAPMPGEVIVTKSHELEKLVSLGMKAESLYEEKGIVMARVVGWEVSEGDAAEQSAEN
jgi:4-amino-4-deoxy-L-arabinose transferase-like glycosyltransferase